MRVFRRPFIMCVIILVICVAGVSIVQRMETDTSAVVSNSVSSDKDVSSKESSDNTNESSPSENAVQSSDTSDTKNEDTSEESNTEMRGVWIPYMSLQLSEDERSEQGFHKKIDAMIEKCVRYKVNTIIVQVRPFGDAIYPSEFFPFSHIISGAQGKAVNYDPLEYIIEKAHENGLAVHAWINPFRISTGQTPPELSESNPYCIWQNDDNKENDSYTFKSGEGIYYDPSYPEVRRLIIDGARELAEKYDIDGLQLDDYFYPIDDMECDKKSYKKYLSSIAEGYKPLSQKEWRKNNINMLISGLYSALHSIRKDIQFGISPQCNFDNNEKIGADTENWCNYTGYVDYICPQLYVSMEHPTFPFKELADKWRSFAGNENIKLYFGLGLYKAGTDADGGTWLSRDDNISSEIEYMRQTGVDGYILYSYDYLDKSEKTEIVNGE